MATKTANKRVTAPKEEVLTAVETNEIQEAKEEKPVEKSVPVKKASTVKTKKTFADEDMIRCTSIINGKLFYEGVRSHTLYQWADADDVQEVEYRDLKYAAMTKDKILFKPRVIVQDKDFLADYPELEVMYGSIYSTKDLADILTLPPAQLKKKAEGLPEGAKDFLKTLVSRKIDIGQFDSIQRVKILDEIFGTEMVLKLTAK